MTPAWIVCAWPRISWQASCTPELHFVHLGTRVLNAGDDGALSAGQTLWGGPLTEGSAGVAWDWVELEQGIVAMADPFGLVTNLQLVGARGEVLSGMETAMRLNAFVRTLPWQHEVNRALQHSESESLLHH